MASQRKGEHGQIEERSKRKQHADRILDAAAELMLRWGYNKTTIDDIARYAGVAKGTIYLQWKTLEDLFLALMKREYIRTIFALSSSARREDKTGVIERFNFVSR